jgi:hypothetical protein
MASRHAGNGARVSVRNVEGSQRSAWHAAALASLFQVRQVVGNCNCGGLDSYRCDLVTGSKLPAPINHRAARGTRPRG